MILYILVFQCIILFCEFMLISFILLKFVELDTQSKEEVRNLQELLKIISELLQNSQEFHIFVDNIITRAEDTLSKFDKNDFIGSSTEIDNTVEKKNQNKKKLARNILHKNKVSEKLSCSEVQLQQYLFKS